MTSMRATLSYRAWKRRSRSCLAQRYSTRWRARTRARSHGNARVIPVRK
jgi:hypothetical protein